MKLHLTAFVLGFLLDLLLGDPQGWPHPVRLIGAGIARLTRLNLPQLTNRQKLLRGLLMTVLVVSASALVSAVLLVLAYAVHPVLGVAAETVMTYQILAVKCLRVESMKVYDRLAASDLQGARTAVSFIVGRDTEALDEAGVTRAAVETVAENASDGVIAPMLCLALGGPVLGFAYKAVNTLDSMVGYKNETYLYFGRCAAKLDDLANFLPSRAAALLLIAGSFLSGAEYDGRRAWKTWRRDRKKHESPNSAQTESACAGSLGIQLAGDAVYFGKPVHKPTLGDAVRPVEAEDIPRANRLMYRMAFLCELLCALALVLVTVCR